MGTVSAGSGFSRVPKENLLDKMFSHVLSVAALASVAVAAPQYYYPGLTPTYYTTGIAQPAAIATPVAVQTPAAAIPAVDLSTLKALFANANAQRPATQGALDQIQGSSLNLLSQVPLETVPIELRADVATLIAASQQLGALNQQTKAANQAELDKILAASNNLLAALPN